MPQGGIAERSIINVYYWIRSFNSDKSILTSGKILNEKICLNNKLLTVEDQINKLWPSLNWYSIDNEIERHPWIYCEMEEKKQKQEALERYK